MNAPERFFEQQNVKSVCPNAYMDFVAQSIEVRTESQFISLVTHALQKILPHGMMLAGIGHARPDGIFARRAIGINYPINYLEKLQKRPIFAGPILSQWMATNEPQIFEANQPTVTIPKRWLSAVRRAGIQNIAAHGVRDVDGFGASYFTFSKIPEALGSQHELALNVIIPHLHLALSRIDPTHGPATTSQEYKQIQPLTRRELEILDWISHGKSDAEIAKTINRSIFTVNNHVKNILTKLGAENRIQAVRQQDRYGKISSIHQITLNS